MDPKVFRDKFAKAAEYYNSGRFPHAVSVLEELLRAHPDHPEVLHTYARTLIQLARYADADRVCVQLATTFNDPRGEELRKRLPPEFRRQPEPSAAVKSDPAEVSAKAPIGRIAAAALLLLAAIGAYGYWIAYPRIFRILEFDPDTAIGSVFALEVTEDGQSEWTSIGTAKGRVDVLRSRGLRLVLDPAAIQPGAGRAALEALLTFEPDTFDEIETTGAPIGDDGLKVLLRFATARRLMLSNSNISGAALVNIAADSPLESLDLSQNPISDEWASWIGQIGALERLDLDGTAITDHGAAELAGLTRMVEFHPPSGMGDEGLKAIRSLTSLRTLDLAGRPITDRGMKFVAELSGLEEIDLSRTAVTDAGVRHIEALQHLQSLNLSETYVSDDTTAFLVGHKGLHTLDLSGTLITPRGTGALAELPGLRWLNLARCFQGEKLGEATMQTLSGFRAIEELNLSGAGFEPAALPALSVPTLRRFVIEESDIAPEDLQKLGERLANCEVVHTAPAQRFERIASAAPLGNLFTRVSVSSGGEVWAFWSELAGDVPIPPAGPLRIVTTPAGLENLATLAKLFGSGLSELSIPAFPSGGTPDYAPLANLSDLTGLEIGQPPPPGMFDHLDQLAALNTLTLRGSGWTQEALEQIRVLRWVEQLSLINTGATAIGAGTLSRFPSLTRLRLQGSALSAVDPAAFAATPGLTEIDVRGAGLSEKALADMASTLPAVHVVHDDVRTRNVMFPADRPVGTLWIRNPSEASAGWTGAAEARGTMTFSAGEILRLDIVTGAGFDATALAEIPPDAIHALNLTGVEADDVNVAPLMRWTALRELSLDGTSVSDETVTRLGAASLGAAFNPASRTLFDRPFMRLTKLSLSGVPVEGRTLRSLRGFTELVELDLAGTSIVLDGIDQLPELGTLRRLGLEHTQLGTFGLSALERDMPETRVAHDVGAVPASTAQPRAGARLLAAQTGGAIGEIFVRPAKSKEGAWTSIGPFDRGAAIPAGMEVRLILKPVDLLNLKPLESLPPHAFDEIVIAPGSRVPESAMRVLGRFGGLRELNLSATELDPGALHHLQDLDGLERLSLPGAHFDRDELWVLRRLRGLRAIDLSGTGSGDEALAYLSPLPALAEIDLHNERGFSDLGARKVAQLPAIERIEANGTSLSDGGFASLIKLPALKFLDVFGSNVTAGAAHAPVETEAIVNVDKRRLSDHEIAELAPKLRDSVRAIPGERGRRIADAIGVTALADVADESLNRIHEVALRAARDTKTTIDEAFLADISGVDHLRDAPEAVRAPLQQAALRSIVEDTGKIEYKDVIEVAGVTDLRQLAPEDLSRMQEFALVAIAQTEGGIRQDDLALVEGVETFDDISGGRLDELQQMALNAMSNSDIGITIDGLATVSGVDQFQQIEDAQLNDLQAMALSALAVSDDGFSSQELAALSGLAEFAQIPEAALGDLQESAMSAMANSERGITSPGIAALGGTDFYDDLAGDAMGTLQELAVETMVNSELEITTEAFSQIGGRDEFAAIPEERREDLQGVTLSAMADSTIGITVDALVEIGGVEEYAEFDDTALDDLQDIALLAMADSSTGITVDGLAVLSGTASIDTVEREELDEIRTRAITAMGKSSTGIQPSKLVEILGDTALTILNLSGSPVGDTDLLNIPDMSRLEVVDLAGCGDITDKGLERLSFAKGLRSLNVSGTRITTQGLFALSGLSNLESLDLSQTSIGDSALSTLSYFPRLESLTLADTGVEGVGLVYLSGTPNLRFLDLARTAITDAGFANTPALASLEHLVLTRTRVTDASTANLERYTTIEALELAGCPGISDSGFEQLSHLSALNNLALHDTQVTEESLPKLMTLSRLAYLTVNQAMFTMASIDELRRALPNCTVSGIGTLKADAIQLAGLVQDTATAGDRFREAALTSAARVTATLYSLSLALAAAFFLFFPFLPAAVTLLDNMQSAGAAGRAAQGARTGARAAYIVTTRGGSALFYTMRWLIGLAVIGILMYYVITLVAEFWDTYLDYTTTRF